MSACHDSHRVWVLRLKRNPYDFMGKVVEQAINMTWGRPEWQHCVLVVKPANQHKVVWLEYLLDGFHEYEVMLDDALFYNTLDKMLFDYYDVINVDDGELQLMTVRMSMLEGATTSRWGYIKYLFSRHGVEDVIVCTTVCSLILSGKLKEVIDVPVFRTYESFKGMWDGTDNEPQPQTQIQKTINLSTWRDGYVFE